MKITKENIAYDQGGGRWTSPVVGLGCTYKSLCIYSLHSLRPGPYLSLRVLWQRRPRSIQIAAVRQPLCPTGLLLFDGRPLGCRQRLFGCRQSYWRYTILITVLYNIHTYIHTYIQTYTHMLIYVHTYMYMCINMYKERYQRSLAKIMRAPYGLNSAQYKKMAVTKG